MQLESVLAHLNQTKAPRSLIHKIRGYYEFRWADEGSSTGEDIFDREVEMLPRSLQLELFQEMHGAYLSKVPALKPLPPMATFFLSKRWSRQMYVHVQPSQPSAALFLFFSNCTRAATAHTTLSPAVSVRTCSQIPAR